MPSSALAAATRVCTSSRAQPTSPCMTRPDTCNRCWPSSYRFTKMWARVLRRRQSRPRLKRCVVRSEVVPVTGNRVIQGDRISVLAPLAVGVVASVCTTAIFLLPLRATIHLVRRQRSLGCIGAPWTDVAIFARVVFYASLGHLVEIGFWALLFMICREFRDFGTAFYHSAVNYTSLGYGDFIMSPSWRLLGPLETANGALLFGVSTAMIFAVIVWLIQIRFKDLKD